jgi:hypothetical protein
VRRRDWIDWLLLSKRPGNYLSMFPAETLAKCWVGTSIEDQATLQVRLPHLLRCPAAVRFLSMEPLLGAVDLSEIPMWLTSETGALAEGESPVMDIGWVIVGGESGPVARPMHPDWARSIRDQCEAAGVPFFFKQWGAWVSIWDRDRDDPDWRGVPEPRNDRERFVNAAGRAWIPRQAGSLHAKRRQKSRWSSAGRAGVESDAGGEPMKESDWYTDHGSHKDRYVWLQLDGYAGRTQQRVILRRLAKGKARIEAIGHTKLGGNRWIRRGDRATVPDYAVTFKPVEGVECMGVMG